METYINKKGELASKYSVTTIVEFCPSLPDTSVEEYKAELLDYLKDFYNHYSTHSMNEGALTLQGEKKMLGSLIKIIEN